jgi:hypothetical protein
MLVKDSNVGVLDGPVPGNETLADGRQVAILNQLRQSLTMTTLTAHFDGRVLVPDKPVKLPVNQPLRVSVVSMSESEHSEEVDELAWQHAASSAVGPDFLAEEPDIYSQNDGRPFDSKG